MSSNITLEIRMLLLSLRTYTNHVIEVCNVTLMYRGPENKTYYILCCYNLYYLRNLVYILISLKSCQDSGEQGNYKAIM